MLTTELVVTIPGHPAPKGSLKCIGGRGGRGHVLIEDNNRTKPWRQKIVGQLATQQRRLPVIDPGQPVGAEITFTLDRPKSHYGTGRNTAVLKPTAPAHPVGHQTGDVDKLLRLVLDALQDAGLLPDDCQVTDVTSRKRYSVEDRTDDVLPWPGVCIRLYPIEE